VVAADDSSPPRHCSGGNASPPDESDVASPTPTGKEEEDGDAAAGVLSAGAPPPPTARMSPAAQSLNEPLARGSGVAGGGLRFGAGEGGAKDGCRSPSAELEVATRPRGGRGPIGATCAGAAPRVKGNPPPPPPPPEGASASAGGSKEGSRERMEVRRDECASICDLCGEVGSSPRSSERSEKVSGWSSADGSKVPV